MINGITPEEYANAVATLCKSNVSIRVLTAKISTPVTQMVSCGVANDEPWLLSDFDGAGEFELTFRRRYGYEPERRKTVMPDFPPPTRNQHFDVCVPDASCFYNAIYDEVLKKVSEIWSAVTDDNLAEMMYDNPVLMFMTTVNGHGVAEDPGVVRRIYVDMLERKYNLFVPDILVRVRCDDLADIGAATKIKFGRFCARNIALSRDELKSR